MNERVIFDSNLLDISPTAGCLSVVVFCLVMFVSTKIAEHFTVQKYKNEVINIGFIVAVILSVIVLFVCKG